MDDHPGLSRANGSAYTKTFAPNPHLYNGATNHPTHPQPRMSYNPTFANSSKELPNYKQQPSKRITNTNHATNSTGFNLVSSGNMKSQIANLGSSIPNKTSTTTNITNSLGNSPQTSKHVPSFLQSRNQMKGSLFMTQEGSGKSQKTQPSSYYNGHYFQQSTNTNKRAPRMSEQPDMKNSACQFGSENYGKVPAFLVQKPEKMQKKQKKIPYQNDLQRPQSSKESVIKNSFPTDSLLSNSYGTAKRIKNDDNNEQIDPTSEWVKKSWNKKKQKKLSINDFQQIKDLGSGKYGQVYLARQKKSNFVIALKIIEKKLIKQEQIVQQFIRELKIQSFLNHPNIIKMYGFFDDHVNIYIILEVGTSGQLFKQLKKHQTMPEAKVAGLMRQVCQAVNELHSHHIIHRDIKPQNIVMSQGVVKLCDFGWSVYSGQTLRTTFCGSPLYVGPQILKGKQYDQKIDIWSMGVMMYQMLVGENPFKITKQQQLIKIVKDQIKIPNYVQISDEAKDFLFSCLQKNPQHRLSIRQLMHHNFFKKYPQKTDKKMAL